MNATSLLLEPLGADECAQLMDRLVTDALLDPRASTADHDRICGNPLYVEEMLAMVREHGARRHRCTADDPRAPAGTHRFARRRRPGRHGARLGRGRGLPSRRCRRALPGSPAAGGRVAPRDARSEGADPLDSSDVSRGRRISLPPSSHPRRRLRVAAEGDPSRAPRALRRLARRSTTSWRATRSSAITSSKPIATARSSTRAIRRFLVSLSAFPVISPRRAGGDGPWRLQRRPFALPAGDLDPRGRRSQATCACG